MYFKKGYAFSQNPGLLPVATQGAIPFGAVLPVGAAAGVLSVSLEP